MADNTIIPTAGVTRRQLLGGAAAALVSMPLAGSVLFAGAAGANGGYPWPNHGPYLGDYTWGDPSAPNRSERHFRDPWGFYKRNCTSYVAWKLSTLNRAVPPGSGHANTWDDKARAAGWAVSSTPVTRSIGVTEGGYGHVAWVEAVNSDGTVRVSEYNQRGDGNYGTRNRARFTSYIRVPGVSGSPTGPDLGRYRNTIVCWDGDPHTTWFVTPDLRRMWIPDGGTFNELRARGFGFAGALSSSVLDQIPDLHGNHVASGSTWRSQQGLRRGMEIRTAGYVLALQPDGNLVWYGPSGRAIWATSFHTSRWREQERVIFQGDGNLVTYSSSGHVWNSRTGGSGADRFVAQADGNLVIYKGSRAVWHSRTGGRR